MCASVGWPYQASVWQYCIDMAVKMTFSLDEDTAERLRRAAETRHKSMSQVLREAIGEYSERLGKLSETERRRMLGSFDELVPKIPERPLAEVDEEIEAVRQARQAGGRRSRDRA